MPRDMPPGLMEAINRPDAQIASHGTLELFILTGLETRSFYWATASLSFEGVVWQPHLRKTPEFSSSMLGEADEAICELQNVDSVLGNEFSTLEGFLSGSEAKVGRYWRDERTGNVWHKVFLTGIVEDVADDEMTVKLTIVSDIYADVSVGPIRNVQRLCQARPYKGFECGSVSTLPTCRYTLGDCQLRHPGPPAGIHLARHMGAPFLDFELLQKID